MILEQTKKDVEVSGDFEQSTFSIQADAQSFNILSSKVYTHKVRAVIRELSCNAHDAHIEAGNPEPFKVHLPTTLEPWFSVRDFGTGLSHEDCMQLYTTYFYSTKRDSKDTTGCLGIGSKSFYCLVESCTITSIHGGKKRIYTAYKDENDIPQMAHLSSVDTDEPNGLEVSMSIDGREAEFVEEAVNVFRFFDKIPDINNKEVLDGIKKWKSDFDFQGEEFSLSAGYGDCYAVMGNVGYNIPAKYMDSLSTDGKRYSSIYGYVRFELGDLEFEAGRENLSLSDKTVDRIKNRFKELTPDVTECIINHIDNQPNDYMRCRTYSRMNRLCLRFNVKKDLKLPTPSDSFTVYSSDSWSNTVRRQETKDVSILFHKKTEFFWEKKGFIQRVRDYLKQTSNQNVILLTHSQAVEMGIPFSLIKNLDTLPKVERVKSYNSSTCKVFKYDMSRRYSKGRNSWIEHEVDANSNEEMVYIEINRWEPTEYNLYTIDSIIRQCSKLNIKFGIFGLKTSFLKTKKFRSLNFIELKDYLARELKDIKRKVYNREIGNDYWVDSITEFVDSGKCNSELIKEFVKIFKIEDHQSDNFRTLKQFGLEVVEDNKLVDLYNQVIDKYPMLKHVSYSSSSKPVVVEYINTIDSIKGK